MTESRRSRLTAERAAQGLPPYIEDPDVLRQVADIVLEDRGRPTNYLKRVPAKEEVPEGLVVVHNSVRGTRRLGSRGFRAWLAPLEGRLEECDCDWAPELGIHYRVGAV